MWESETVNNEEMRELYRQVVEHGDDPSTIHVDPQKMWSHIVELVGRLSAAEAKVANHKGQMDKAEEYIRDSRDRLAAAQALGARYREALENIPPELLEALAELEHEKWSGWMKHQFRKGTFSENKGTWTMPKWAVERWKRLAETNYSNMPETSKESDRVEARKTWSVISARLALPTDGTALREAQAKAWDKGYKARTDDLPKFADGTIEALATNPHRTTEKK